MWVKIGMFDTEAVIPGWIFCITLGVVMGWIFARRFSRKQR